MSERHRNRPYSNRQACFFSDKDYRLNLDLLATSCQTHYCEIHDYLRLFNYVLEHDIVDNICYRNRKGLPTGNKRIKSKIEKALLVKLRDGKQEISSKEFIDVTHGRFSDTIRLTP